MSAEAKLLETAWRLRGPLGHILDCTIHSTDDGFIVQIAQAAGNVSRKCAVGSLTRARDKADEWRTALLGLSEFAAVVDR